MRLVTTGAQRNSAGADSHGPPKPHLLQIADGQQVRGRPGLALTHQMLAIGKTRRELHNADPLHQYINLSAADWAAHQSMLEAHRADVLDHIAELGRNLEHVEGKIRHYRQALDD